MKNASRAVAIASCLIAPAALADYNVSMNAIDAKGVGKDIGTVKVAIDPKGGVSFTPDLRDLPPGAHGFHVHEFANCSAKEKDGKLEAGEAAGGHYDPKKTGKHMGPKGEGHAGDLGVLEVNAQGTATKTVSAPRLGLGELANKSLMIHAGGDNYADAPKPNGGGGTRIACGVIQAGAK